MGDLASTPAKIVRVVDIETSGLPEDEQHAICEMGWVDLDLAKMTIGNPVTFLVNPGHKIPPHVRAVHHISDADVAGAMRPDQALTQLFKGLGENDVLAAHKADFEQAFIGGTKRWVCTLKCAYRAWPELVSHSNQAIRYALGFDDRSWFDSLAAMPPHRSLPDAYTTAHILRDLLDLRPLDRLIEISLEPGFLPRMPIGKHHGMKFAEVPTDYLEWCVKQKDMRDDVVFTARHYLKKREAADRVVDTMPAFPKTEQG